MCWIFENAEKLGGLATVITAIVAVAAAIFAWRTIESSRASQQEATAKDIYRDYLRLAFDNPKLANPRAFENPERLKQDEKYRWFVAFMLNSCDEIARSQPEDNSWRKAIIEDLKFHVDYLKSSQFKEDGGRSLYSLELRDIIDDVIK